MDLRLACVGRLRQPFTREGASHYAHRIEGYARLEIREVRSGRDELRDLGRALAGCRTVLLLDRKGKELDSEQLAALLAEFRDTAQQPIGLAIGGADGIPRDFGPPGSQRISFGRLTHPHELFRVILLEQLYRALTILRGGPYHSGH